MSIKELPGAKLVPDRHSCSGFVHRREGRTTESQHFCQAGASPTVRSSINMTCLPAAQFYLWNWEWVVAYNWCVLYMSDKVLSWIECLLT